MKTKNTLASEKIFRIGPLFFNAQHLVDHWRT